MWVAESFFSFSPSLQWFYLLKLSLKLFPLSLLNLFHVTVGHLQLFAEWCDVLFQRRKACFGEARTSSSICDSLSSASSSPPTPLRPRDVICYWERCEWAPQYFLSLFSCWRCETAIGRAEIEDWICVSGFLSKGDVIFGRGAFQTLQKRHFWNFCLLRQRWTKKVTFFAPLPWRTNLIFHFETIGSEWRNVVKNGVEHFVSLSPQRVKESVERVRSDEIDILVNMDGFSNNGLRIGNDAILMRDWDWERKREGKRERERERERTWIDVTFTLRCDQWFASRTNSNHMVCLHRISRDAQLWLHCHRSNCYPAFSCVAFHREIPLSRDFILPIQYEGKISPAIIYSTWSCGQRSDQGVTWYSKGRVCVCLLQ